MQLVRTQQMLVIILPLETVKIFLSSFFFLFFGVEGELVLLTTVMEFQHLSHSRHDKCCELTGLAVLIGRFCL